MSDRVAPAVSPARNVDLAVIGAGVMGSWTAYLARQGGRTVALLDAYGAGHPRATSGDETRLTRAAHGGDALYTRWSRQSLETWRRFADERGVRLFVPSGLLWFAHREGAFEAESIATFDAQVVPYERLEPDELRRRWPQLGVSDGMRFALYEPEGGVLMARQGCREVVAAFAELGGSFDCSVARPARTDGRRLLEIATTGHGTMSAGQFVFACGPWLPRLFPDLLWDVIRVTKQDVVLVGPAAGDRRFHAEAVPAWADYDAGYYGVPAIDDHGFKVGPDRYGPLFDPSNGERVVDAESIRLARAYLRRRFPDLSQAPVVETRVCQYETTRDAHFLIAQHPDWDNVWLVGGGSGHGYKHGPRIGEYVLARLDGVPEGDQDGDDERRFRIGPRSPGSAARTGGDEMARAWELF
ncbi:MAG: FAD-dependent oxidoreductase [Chloroflexi bacterium]|nr:FAD-dependent oxidoreductase [Chloroflexota bacterium]